MGKRILPVGRGYTYRRDKNGRELKIYTDGTSEEIHDVNISSVTYDNLSSLLGPEKMAIMEERAIAEIKAQEMKANEIYGMVVAMSASKAENWISCPGITIKNFKWWKLWMIPTLLKRKKIIRKRIQEMICLRPVRENNQNLLLRRSKYVEFLYGHFTGKIQDNAV